MKLSQIFQIQCHFHRGRKNASSRIEFNKYRPKSLRMSIRCSRRICSPNLVRVASQDSEKIVPSLGKSRTPMMLKACSSASERTPGFFTSGISISLSERSHREWRDQKQFQLLKRIVWVEQQTGSCFDIFWDILHCISLQKKCLYHRINHFNTTMSHCHLPRGSRYVDFPNAGGV